MDPDTTAGAPAVVGDPAPAPAGTPSPEQTPPPAAATTSATTPPAPANVPHLQAAYTQVSQLNSVMLRELGLQKGATEADVKAAVARMRAKEVSTTITDPTVLDALHRARETQWNANRQIYGEELTNTARQLREAIATSDDPDEIVQLLHRAVTAQQQAAPAAASAAPPPEQAAPAAPAAPPAQDVPMTFGSTIDLGDQKPDIDMSDLRSSGRPEDFFKRLRGKIPLPLG